MLHKARYSVGYVDRHQKTYLNREMSRALAAEYPIGDPHGGPAYGERNEPISALLAIGTMVSTGGAVLAGTASLMTGLAFAGAAISLVGNITGNKTLSKIGMITGLIGGVGALAESVGGFTIGDTMGKTFGYGAGAPTVGNQAAGNVAANAAANSADDVINVADDAVNLTQRASNPVTGAMDDLAQSASGTAPAGGFGNNAPSSAATAPADRLAQSVSNTQPAGGFGAPSTPSAPGLITSAAPSLDPMTAAQVGGGNAGANALLTGPMDDLANAVSGTPSNILSATANPIPSNFTLKDYVTKGWEGVKSIGSGVMDFAKNNPNGAYMIGSVASTVGDWLSGKTDAEINALEQQGELSKAQADRLRYEVQLAKDRKAQLNQNYQNVNVPIQVNPNAVTITPPGGLVSGAMAPRP